MGTPLVNQPGKRSLAQTLARNEHGRRSDIDLAGASSRARSVAWLHQAGRRVALATLVEYVVATYGRERLPALVAGLGQYESWDTLLPAVFGVSATEFEAGWQAYLVAHYTVSPDALQK